MQRVVLAFLMASAGALPALAQSRPANDDVASAMVLQGESGSVVGSNRGATREVGEPEHAGVRGGASVWWIWQAHGEGHITFDTSGSDFDTVLAVYTGTSLHSLQQVAANDDYDGATWSQASFSTGEGTTYLVAVDGYGGAVGAVVLNWQLIPRREGIRLRTTGGSIQVRSGAGIEVFTDDMYLGATTSSAGGMLITGLPEGNHTLRFLRGATPHEEATINVPVVSGAISVVELWAAGPVVWGEPTAWLFTGELAWVDQFGTTGEDSALGVSISPFGQIYVSGFTTGDMAARNAGGRDAFLRQYSPGGVHSWTHQLGERHFDEHTGVAVDAAHVVVAGRTGGSHSTLDMGDVIVHRVNPDDGEVLWSRRYSTPTRDVGNGVAVDALGPVVVGTRTQFGHIGSNHTDAFVWRLNPDGRELWSDTFGSRGQGDDSGTSVAVDVTGSGAVFVAGTTSGELADAHAGRLDAFVRKYSRDGFVEWTRQLGTDANDIASAIAVDRLGNVVLVGTTRGAMGESRLGVVDAYVARLSSAGDVLWIRQFGTSASELVGGVAVDSCGNIVVAGSTNGLLTAQATGRRDGFVVMMDSEGREIWTRQFGEHGDMEVSGVAVTDGGQIAVVGSVDWLFGDRWHGGRDAFVALFSVSCAAGTPACCLPVAD